VTTLPQNATNILTDEVGHWVSRNLVVCSSIRMVLQHCQHLVNWECHQYNQEPRTGETLCNRHAMDLLSHEAVWTAHMVNNAPCNCNANAMIPRLINTFTAASPLAHDNVIVLMCRFKLLCLRLGALYQCCLLSTILFYIRT
jgi:hypothetical protein